MFHFEQDLWCILFEVYKLSALTLKPSSFSWCAVARKLGRNECWKGQKQIVVKNEMIQQHYKYKRIGDWNWFLCSFKGVHRNDKRPSRTVHHWYFVLHFPLISWSPLVTSGHTVDLGCFSMTPIKPIYVDAIKEERTLETHTVSATLNIKQLSNIINSASGLTLWICSHTGSLEVIKYWQCLIR